MENIEDKIVLCYDQHKESSPCLVVARQKREKTEIINTFWNEKAKRLYKELTSN